MYRARDGPTAPGQYYGGDAAECTREMMQKLHLKCGTCLTVGSAGQAVPPVGRFSHGFSLSRLRSVAGRGAGRQACHVGGLADRNRQQPPARLLAPRVWLRLAALWDRRFRLSGDFFTAPSLSRLRSVARNHAIFRAARVSKRSRLRSVASRAERGISADTYSRLRLRLSLGVGSLGEDRSCRLSTKVHSCASIEACDRQSGS